MEISGYTPSMPPPPWATQRLLEKNESENTTQKMEKSTRDTMNIYNNEIGWTGTVNVFGPLLPAIL